MSSEPSPSATPTPTAPTHPTAGPSPLQIGKSFIKQYYKTLLEKPSQIQKFYQPDSIVSRGMQPSSPTDPTSISDLLAASSPGDESTAATNTPAERIRKSFFEWAGKGMDELHAPAENGMDDEPTVLRIDFERGAIDAQESVGGGILLVVTGHMFLPLTPLSASPFVHTFFLNNGAPPGRKRQFYVKNDVLRFLEQPAPVGGEMAAVLVVEEEEEEEIAEKKEEQLASAVAVEVAKVEDEAVAPVEESVAVDTTAKEEAAEETKSDSSPALLVEEPAGTPPETTSAEPALVDDSARTTAVESPVEDAVEESKEEIIISEPVAVLGEEPAVEEEKIDLTADPASSDSLEASPSADGKRKRNRRRRGGKSSRSNSPPNGGSGDRDEETEADNTKEEAQPEKPKTPGSWASLVAGGSAPAPKEDGSGGNRSKGPKQDRRGRSPKGQRDDKPTSTTTTTNTNHDSPAKAPPQSQPLQRAAPSKESTPMEQPSTSTSTTAAPAPQSQNLSAQRTPEATLFIRNIPDATKESEVRALFESHGAATGNKILGVTLNANRGFCFVDFDGPAAVNAIVAEAQSSLVKDQRTGRKVESSFMAHGRVLDVEKKVKSQGMGGGGGGGGGRRYNRSPPGSRGSRGSGMRRSPPRDGGRRSSGGGGGANR